MIDPFTKDKKEKTDNYESNKLIPFNSKKMKNQHKIIINNLEVYFPFSPHEIQIIYMKKIIYNLNEKFLLQEKYKAIAALESPVGTGKTLCLLCATLAWVNDMRKTNSYNGKIIYTAKTYNKISHIINELNKTYYKPNICVLFSPYDACINNKINNSKNDRATYMKCNNNKYNCEFYKNNLTINNANINSNNNNIDEDYKDIEELSDSLCCKKVCPFYYEKNNINNSDIIFMPYDFLFDKDVKEMLEYDINNNILIIDESHNLTKICQDVQSISITTKDLEEINEELYQFTKNNSKDINININYKVGISEIKSEIMAINKIINHINDNKLNILQGEVYPDKGILLSHKEFLSIFLTKSDVSKIKLDVNNNNNSSCETDLQYITLDNISHHIFLFKSIEKLIYLYLERNTKMTILISVLEKIYNFYINQNDNNIESYMFFLTYLKNEDEPNNAQNMNKLSLKKKNEDQVRKLNIYCFDPSLSFKEIINDKPYALFLTSDTLSPFDILENEFKIKFDIKLQNEHIIENEQYKFSIIKSSLYNGEKITFQLDYLHRSNVKMIIGLGYTLLSLCHTNKNGSILVYFPSMPYLNQCYLIWKDNTIIDKLQEINNIYYSQKNLKKLKKLKNNKNYIFFVVFDMTSPEEIFFRESNITMVVCLGIPYDTQYSYDDKIQLKIKYLDDKIKNIYTIKDELTGEKWYQKNAIYIINRFLGKALKFLSGNGSLICIDNRYESALNNGLFSSYLKHNCEIINIEDSSYFESLISFFDNMNKNYIKNFNFFNSKLNNNINEPKKAKAIQYKKEDEESENYFFNKRHDNKIFYIPDLEEIADDLIKNSKQSIEDILLNTQKINKYLNMSNIIPLDKKDFLQKKKNKQNEDISEDENNKMNKKVKHEEIQNKETTIKPYYNYNYGENNIFQNFCAEYDNIQKHTEEVKKGYIIRNNENQNENVNSITNANNNNSINNTINDNRNEEVTQEIFDQLNENTYTEDSKNVYECPICFKISNKNTDLKYSMSKCHHVLCNLCWAAWLTEKLECPLCKAKARPKTLKRIIFINDNI